MARSVIQTPRKRNLLGVLVDCVNRRAASDAVVAAGRDGRYYAVSATAVHGLMLARNSRHRRLLNTFDLITPDGQPVRWALNMIHHAGLAESVRGTDLVRDVLARAERDRLPVFFYGTRRDVLRRIESQLQRDYPELTISGLEPSLFRTVQPAELAQIARKVELSGARILFVGLGCPRQEMFVAAMREQLDMPVLAVGAAFDYLAGTLREPPRRVSDRGFEWIWRLIQEPTRLWRRYLLLNPYFAVLVFAQAVGLWHPELDTTHAELSVEPTAIPA